MLTKLGTSQYHLLQSVEMDNSNTPKQSEKWAYCFWEYLPEQRLRITCDVPCMPWCDRHQLNPGPTQRQQFGKHFKLHWAALNTKMMQKKHKEEAQQQHEWNKSISVYSDTTFWLRTEMSVIQMADICTKIFMEDTVSTRLLPEMGHLGSHISQHVGK